MPNPVFLEPVEGEDPCGADMQWDADFLQLQQDLERAKASSNPEAFVDGEMASNREGVVDFADVVEQSEGLLKKTKDIRVAAIYVEASWLYGGLSAFADAMADTVAMIEAWPDAKTGVYPRADEEDEKDLGERGGAIGKLLHQIPQLVVQIGWGDKPPEISERQAVTETLKNVFDSWTNRLEASFGMDLPSALDAWKSIRTIAGDESAPTEAGTPDQQGGGVALGAASSGGDAWDAVERAAELMAQQDRHSPALPVLRLLGTWRGLGIIDIATGMKASGVSLEQLLESVRKQVEAG